MGINPTHVLEDFCIRVGAGSNGLRRILSRRIPPLPPGEYCWVCKSLNVNQYRCLLHLVLSFIFR